MSKEIEDKAKEIVLKFLPFCLDWNYVEDRPLPLGDQDNYAKQCAIIHVNGIIEILDKEGYDDEDYKIIYYNQVLSAIKNI